MKVIDAIARILRVEDAELLSAYPTTPLIEVVPVNPSGAMRCGGPRRPSSMTKREIGDDGHAGYSARMRPPHRCFVVVPNTTSELYSQLVTAFADDPRVFVLRDRRGGERALDAVGVFAVGGGDLDAALRRSVEDKLRSLGAVRGPTARDSEPTQGET